MKQSTYNIIIAILVLIIAIGGAVLAFRFFGSEQEAVETTIATTQATQPPAQENMAPDFTMEDAQGKSVKLSDFRGKPVVLNFWATWCGPCKAEMPELEKAYQEYGDRVQFVMVDLVDGWTETKEAGLAHITESGYTFPVFFDVDAGGAAAYRISAIPLTCFIDAQGVLVSSVNQMITGEQLTEGIESILSE